MALFEKGQIDQSQGGSYQSIKDFEESLDHFSSALELDGFLIDALFDRALCRQKMSQLRQAERYWREYLEKGSEFQMC